jgi:hypothetical protein
MGNGPWFPKNLYTRVRVLLGLTPGRYPNDWRARLGLRPSSFYGESGACEGRRTLYCPPAEPGKGTLEAVPPPRLTILKFLPYPPSGRRQGRPAEGEHHGESVS